MNEHQIHDAIGDISEELIDPVARLRQKKRYPAVKWLAAAACLCLLLSLPFTWNTFTATKAESMNTEFAPEANMSNRFDGMLDKTENSAADMIVNVSAFRGKVLEVDEECVLVEPLEGEQEQLCSDKIYVSIGKLAQIPEIRVGDILQIQYDGMIQETYPAQINVTYAIEIIE